MMTRFSDADARGPERSPGPHHDVHATLRVTLPNGSHTLVMEREEPIEPELIAVAQADELFDPFKERLISTVLVKTTQVSEYAPQSESIEALSGKRQRLACLFEGTIWIPQHPRYLRRITQR